MFFSRKTTGKVVLLLEVQSSVVRGSLFWFRPGLPPSILFSDSRIVPYKPQVGTVYFIKVTMKALTETLDANLRRLHDFRSEEAYLEMPQEIAEAHYVLSSPWVVSQARTLSLSFDKDTAITEDKMEAILAKERGSLMPKDGTSLEVIEEKIFAVRLNGYSLSSWVGKAARELEISYAATVGGFDSTKRFKDALKQAVRSGRVLFHSSLLLQYVSLRTIMPTREAYTLVHIHGEITDVVVVDRGSCVFFCSYPTGANGLVRRLSRVTKTDLQAADSLISLYEADNLDEDHARSITPVMNELGKNWGDEMTKLFKDSRISQPLPPSTIIAAHSHEKFFVDTFRASHPGSRIELLTVDEVAPHVVFEDSADHLRIVGMYALAIFNLSSRPI
ncbi:MAG: hypothetical protein WCV82_01125 [Candidatus Paceibacterota bacterium]